MKKKIKNAALISLVFALLVTVQIASGYSQRFKAAYQLSENDSYKPETCFVAKTHAGMKTSNESVTFGSKKNADDLGATFEFDASCTKDKDNSTKELQFTWDFDDGNEDYLNGKGNYKVSHIYYETGTYTPRLTVTDPDGNKQAYEFDVKVVKNNGPHNKLTVSPDTGTFNQEFTFDASATYHDQFQDKYLEYCWDFNGDKKIDEGCSNSKKKVKYTYPFGTVKEQTVLLEVRDPAWGSITSEYHLNFIKNTAPQTRTVVAPGLNGTFETRFSLDSTYSLDTESDYKCRLDSDYNGTDDIVYDGNFSTSCRWTLQFDKVGKQQVHIQLEDEDGSRTDEYLTFQIHNSSPYFEFLKSKKIVSGYSYKLYLIENSNGNLELIHEDDLAEDQDYLKNYYIQNDMQPDGLATRAELLKMAMTAFDISTNGIPYNSNIFADISSKDWFYRYVVKANLEGILNGVSECDNAGNCKQYAKANDTIKRGEALAVILRASDFESVQSTGAPQFRDVPKSHWAFQYIETAYKNKLLSPLSDEIFGVDKEIKRFEIAEILYKMMNF